jgi:hypothetical protein
MSLKKIKNTGIPRLAEIEEVFLNATSTDIDARGKTQVVLYWKPVKGAVGYNIYRSDLKSPINGTRPIQQVDSCARLKAIIPAGSREWTMLADAFSSVTSRSSIKVVSDRRGRGRIEDSSALFARRMISPGTSLELQPAGLKAAALDPCDVVQRSLTDKEQVLFDSLAGANLKIRLARGWAAIDRKVIAGKTYTYELRGVFERGKEVVLDRDVIIKAGHFLLPNPPSGFDLLEGDSQILALWNRNNYAFSYLLQRSDTFGGTYETVNESPIIYDITKDLQNQDLSSPRPGFVDFQRWDDEGLPVSHAVKGIDIDGPTNGTTYYYHVASCDILDRHGGWSAPLPGTPVDSTPPTVPTDLRVDVNTSPFCLALSWRKVTRDARHHQILETIQTYKIYRSDVLDDLDDLTNLPAFQIGTATADPTDPTTITLSWLDMDPALRVPYGEKDFWYRLRCVDAQGNESAPSAAIAGRLPDITPPGPTRVIGGDGYADHISVYWLPNPEPDLAGYQIYRSLCDRGRPYRPPLNPEDKRTDNQERGPCDFVLVGEVSLIESQTRLADTGRIFFDDFSVPSGSPVCYCYWVRAFDIARNLYPGDHGCPASPDEYTCQRLYEETPPPVPIITALKARDREVLIEWIASPVQDLHAFHIYRSDKEFDTPVFIGCVLSDGTLYLGKWLGQKPDCGEIPAEVDPASIHGSFRDKTAEANHIYWYRVSALDWLGNESGAADLLKIPAISTFTYSRELPDTPVVLPPAGSPPVGCGLVVTWNPVFMPGDLKGFLVFRSTASAGDYRQVSALVQANSFEDRSAIRGMDYWYRVQSMAPDGNLSLPSAPVKYGY